MEISYSLTVCNEITEIKKLIPFLIKNIKEEDEIVILYDSKNGDPKVWEYLNLVSITGDNLNKIKIYKEDFNGDFSQWKNKLNSLCSKKYIFNLDSDEIPDIYLLQNLHKILNSCPNIDLIYIPRVNIVTGITEDHLRTWGWDKNEKGYINWNSGDYQSRIYKNSPHLKWEGNVHETIKGFKIYSQLPKQEKYSIYHFKTIERQEKQNNLYNNL